MSGGAHSSTDLIRLATQTGLERHQPSHLLIPTCHRRTPGTVRAEQRSGACCSRERLPVVEPIARASPVTSHPRRG
jgi:hypothetical protein